MTNPHAPYNKGVYKITTPEASCFNVSADVKRLKRSIGGGLDPFCWVTEGEFDSIALSSTVPTGGNDESPIL